jgi:methylated-DNA-[protein]-cysteine S-methyltransferase
MNTQPSSDHRLTDELEAAFPVAGLTELHARLPDRAAEAGLLDVAVRTVDSPYGSLLLAATEDGLVRLAFDVEDHDHVLAQLATIVSPRILASASRTDAVARQLDEYFAGRRRAFDVALDLRLVTGFRRTVISQLPEIAYGSTRTYAAVAAAAGNPGAVRAVGSACSHNPIPLVVPCHRVVRSDGTVGEYLGGTATKAALLAMEAASWPVR